MSSITTTSRITRRPGSRSTVELFAELVGDHFEAGAQSACVERDTRLPANDAVAFMPPRSIGIAHDFADAFIEQQRLDGAEEWKR